MPDRNSTTGGAVLGRHGDTRALVTGHGVHLGVLTAAMAGRYGDRIAIEDDAATPGLHAGGPRRFTELEEHVARIAAALRARGVGPDDRLLVAVGNRVDVLLYAFAAARLGAVPALVNPRLSAGELAGVREAVGALRAVADPEVADRMDGVEILATTDLADWFEDNAHARIPPPKGLDPEATALLLTTSGTTGTPKAAALSSRGLLGSLGLLAAVPVGRRRGLRAGRDTALAALPLPHVMGFSVACAMLCAGVPLLHRSSFDPEGFLGLIERRGVNVVAGVPTMYADLEAAGAADRDLSTVQLWVSAADAMPAERARAFQRFGAAMRVGGRPVGAAAFADVYGMVELSGGAALRLYLPSIMTRALLPPISIVLPGLEVRAVDEDGASVGWGTVGELEFRGRGVLARYEGRPDAGPDEQGWFPTGDHGRVWPGGVFSFSGRRRDRLKVGGFSVFPAEVENELTDAPHVRELAIVGLPDDRLGERPIAVVVPAGDAFDVDEFLEFAQQRVAGYRRPRDVVIADSIPRGPNGKIDRPAATELAAGRH